MRRYLLGIAVAAVVGAAGWLVLGQQRQPEAPLTQVQPKAPPGALPQSKGQPATEAGALRFESVPPGAEVVGPSGVLGVTPFAVPIPKAGRPKSVVYRMKGYYTQQRTVPKRGDLVSAEMFRKKPNR